MQFLIKTPVRIYRLQLIGENVPVPAQTEDKIALVRCQKKAMLLKKKDINQRTVIDNIPRPKLNQEDIDLTPKKNIQNAMIEAKLFKSVLKQREQLKSNKNNLL